MFGDGRGRFHRKSSGRAPSSVRSHRDGHRQLLYRSTLNLAHLHGDHRVFSSSTHSESSGFNDYTMVQNSESNQSRFEVSTWVRQPCFGQRGLVSFHPISLLLSRFFQTLGRDLSKKNPGRTGADSSSYLNSNSSTSKTSMPATRPLSP